jgi:Reverse transcriptase (RNA-dependent DNA polymerase)
VLEMFSNYFASVFTESKEASLTLHTTNDSDEAMGIVQYITEEVVCDILNKLKLNKSPGPDGIPNIVLKYSQLTLSGYLTRLFKLSLSQSKVPDEWKHASVIPIHKSGNVNKCENYRPVSLTSTVCKVMEKIVLDRIHYYVSKLCPLSDSQFGFRINRSCSSQLVSYTDLLTKAIDKGLCVDVVYLDFSKAFDRVSHDKLIQKMHQRKIPLTITKWVQAFLAERTQSVVIQQTRSTERKVTSGVPQGSILGPILFLLFTDDIDKIIIEPIVTYKFADDMKLCNVFDPKCTTSDAHDTLQRCINNLYRWCVENSLPLNLKKCSIVHFGSTNTRQPYYFELQQIETHSTERDLGVIFDEHISFQSHIDSIVNRARRLTCMMFRSFYSRSPSVIVPIYKTLIRPLLEYATAVWNPHQLKQVKQVESVQRYITKRILKYSNASYDERLRILHIPSLEARRKYFDLVEIYKVVNKLSFVDNNLSYSFVNRPSRGHVFRIRCCKYTRNVRKFALFVRAINAWNIIPSYIVNETQLPVFKRLLCTYLNLNLT